MFDNNPEKRQLLFDKVQKLFNTYGEFYKIYVDDAEIKLKVKKVNDIGNLFFTEYSNESSKLIKLTIEFETTRTGKVELDTNQVWKLDGNKLMIDSDTNYFLLMGQELILEYMRTIKRDIIHSPDRLRKNSEVGGIEDFANANNLILEHGTEIRRNIYSYDHIKMTDTIMILKEGSLDYYMYIELMK